MTKNNSQKLYIILEPIKSIMHPVKMINPKGWQELLTIALQNNETEVTLNCSNYGNIVMTRKMDKTFEYFETKDNELDEFRPYLPKKIIIEDASLKIISVDESDDMKKIKQSKSFYKSALTVRFKIARKFDK